MTLAEYFRKKGRGAKSRLARETGLAYSTIHWIERGRSEPKRKTAKLISAATGGEVTVAEILGLAEGEAA